MAKMKNQRIYSDDLVWLRGLYEDCRDYIGRECAFEVKDGHGMLTLFALPQHRKTRKEKAKQARNKRAEKHKRD